MILKSIDSGCWSEIQQNTKQGAESTEIGSWAKCDEQFKSLTLSKGRGDDYWIAEWQFESLTTTKFRRNDFIIQFLHFIQICMLCN